MLASSLVLLLPFLSAVQEEAPAPSPPEPEARFAYEPGYRGLADVELLLAEFALAFPGEARAFELTRSRGGRPVPAVEFGAQGDVPLAERPTLFLIGGLDGRSLVGAEAVLAALAELHANAAELSPEVAVVCVPWAGTDGLARTLEGAGDGRNDRPVDDDGDGLLDEDGPEDVDGDGVLLQMLIEDPNGAWRRGADPRRVEPAEPGDLPRYRRTQEGTDTDGDGRYNEDPVGGVALDQSFPVGWLPPWEAVSSGPWPLSEPGARALADLFVSRRAVCVLLFQGDHGGLATPGGRAAGEPAPHDMKVFEGLARSFEEATGRTGSGPRSLRATRGREVPGAMLDWVHEALGVPALEVAPWGPGVELSLAAEDAELEAAWLRWVDNARGGIGFEAWHPVDLGGPPALVGGWLPRTRVNPPDEVLPSVLAGLGRFAARTARELPRLELEVHAQRDGAVCQLEVRVRNVGGLATSLWNTGAWRGGEPRIELSIETPEEAAWFAGEREVQLAPLFGGETSRTVRWTFVLPPRGQVKVHCSAPLCAPLVMEVRP